MNKEELIEVARKAGFVDYELDDGTTNAFDKRYEAFARLVAEKEREACAKVCEDDDSNAGEDIGTLAVTLQKQSEQEEVKHERSIKCRRHVEVGT